MLTCTILLSLLEVWPRRWRGRKAVGGATQRGRRASTAEPPHLAQSHSSRLGAAVPPSASKSGLRSMPPRAHPARGENWSHRMAPGVGTHASAGVDNLQGIQVFAPSSSSPGIRGAPSCRIIVGICWIAVWEQIGRNLRPQHSRPNRIATNKFSWP